MRRDRYRAYMAGRAGDEAQRPGRVPCSRAMLVLLPGAAAFVVRSWL
jgi:hypothetical protein